MPMAPRSKDLIAIGRRRKIATWVGARSVSGVVPRYIHVLRIRCLRGVGGGYREVGEHTGEQDVVGKGAPPTK